MIEVTMPQLGESVAEGTITQWHVRPGDHVKREQPLVEVATDKADSEVPSPSDGVIVELVVQEGDIVPTGNLLCTIDEAAAAGAERSGATPDSGEASEPRAPSDGNGNARQATQPDGGGAQLSSPSTRRLARDRGVDLSQLAGSGDRGRITRADVERAASAGLDESADPSRPMSLPVSAASIAGAFEPPSSRSPLAPAARAASGDAAEIAQLMQAHLPVPGVGYRAYKVPAYREQPGDQVVPFTRRRRITADHMVYSQAVSPHVVTVAEIDLAATSRLRDQHKRAFEKEGVPLTFLTFVVGAVTKALREFPTLNARVLDDSYVVLKDINVGVAIETPGGLLVANLKRTDKLSLRGVAMGIDELAGRAREGKVTADDLMGTTFTVSNPGRRGNLFGGAIISQPNVAILRVGEIKKRAVVVTSPDGEDHIAIHPVMYAALSYDHRIVDGVEANAFLWRIGEVLGTAEFQL